MKLKKVHSALIAAALICSLAVTPAFAEPTQDELQDQKEAVQSELGNLQAELNALIQKTSELENELISTGQEIMQAEEDLAAAEEKTARAFFLQIVGDEKADDLRVGKLPQPPDETGGAGDI